MDIYKTLDLLERVEREVSGLYKKLHEDYRLNKEVSTFFYELHMEEETHVQMIRMERRIVQGAPKAFTDVQVNLSEISSLLENIVDLKTAKLELSELIGRVYSIESNPAEKYLIDAIRDTNDDLRDFLLQLGDGFSAHAERVAVFARKLGVQIEDVQNRFLRKARLRYDDKVLINLSLSARGVDISEGGLFVLTGRTFRAGDRLAIQFSVLQTTISADATVQFVIADVGMGLMFTALADSDAELIKQYIMAQLEEKGVEKQKRVLLVGNDKLPGRDMRVYMHTLLSAGYKVVDLNGFEVASNFLRQGPNLSCIILSIESETDVNYFLISFISLIERYKNTPLLVMTNSQNRTFREALLRKGVKKLLVRMSTSPKRLTEELDSILAGPASASLKSP